ncbi:hypothetical protein [Bradyrhizobium sp. LA7.1]|uniref:hypothetical protein n=2 Tax=unclassified Bradyrhizobium TaxID=2631580 RepID=UPI003396D003
MPDLTAMVVSGESSLMVAIVDDDPAVLRALIRLLRSHAFCARAYGSGQEFLAALLPVFRPDCLIVDLPTAGNELVGASAASYEQGHKDPTILITARAEAALRGLQSIPEFTSQCSPANMSSGSSSMAYRQEQALASAAFDDAVSFAGPVNIERTAHPLENAYREMNS